MRPTSERHPAFFTAANLLLITPLCVLGAIIGTQLIVTLGITTNTSLIGALAGMALGRLPMAAFARYRSIHVQNLGPKRHLGRDVWRRQRAAAADRHTVS